MSDLKCVVCAILPPTDRGIQKADFVLNGQSVCHTHAPDISAKPGVTNVLIGNPEKP